MDPVQPAQHKRSTIYLIVAGLGLVLVGISAIFLLPRAEIGAAAPSEAVTIPAEVEYPAPELSLQDLQGNTVSLAGLRGQVVLVNLWATWCPPCKKEMPALQRFFDDHKAQGFTVLAINDGDPTADVVKFVGEYRLTFTVLLDPTYIATEQAFQTLNLPSSFVIDRSGTIRLRWVGEATTKMLETYVTPIITE
jgi:peroxiredoxin